MQATELLTAHTKGDKEAASKLFELVYDEIRRLATKLLSGERATHTLEPTALVHEAYLKLIDITRIEWRDRAHFFAMAVKVLRRLLVEHARRRNTQKRGGDGERVTLQSNILFTDFPVDILALEEALEDLRTLHERQCRVVELRFLSGLEVTEVAEILGVSPGTVKGDWRFARVWLKKRLEGGEPE